MTATTLKLRALTQQILILTTTSKAAMSCKSFKFSWQCCWKSSLQGCDTHWVSGSFFCRAKQSNTWIAWPCTWRTSILPNVGNYSPNNRVSHPTGPE